MSILEILSKCCLLFFLGGAAWMDYREKELPLIYIAVGFGAGLLLQILTGAAFLIDNLLVFLPGLFCLLVAKLSKEAIGYGDALMLIASGPFCPLITLLFLLFGGFLLAGIVSIFLLLLKKWSKKEEIPLMPFLLSGYVLTLAFL